MLRSFILLLLLVVPVLSYALSPTTNQHSLDQSFTVGVKHAPPFAYMYNGEWTGLTIDLVNIISKENNWKVTFQDEHSILGLLDSVENGTVDFGAAAISTTAEREAIMDFSQPYHSSPMGIMSTNSQNLAWWVISRILMAFGILVVVMYVVGAFMDKLDGDINIKTPHDGAWWSLVTFTTTGYGDVVPHSGRGKLFAALWMLTSMFLASVFTGYVSSSLTVMRLSQQEVVKLEDGYNKRVVVVEGSSAQKLLIQNAIDHETVPSIISGRVAIIQKEADMFVHDRDILERIVQGNDKLSVSVIPNQVDYYAIAFSTGNPLREPMNIAIMKAVKTLYWERLLLKYFPL